MISEIGYSRQVNKICIDKDHLYVSYNMIHMILIKVDCLLMRSMLLSS